MTNKLFVARLSDNVTDQVLNTHFSKAGTVTSAKVIINRDNGMSKGFGFVEMSSEEEARKAVQDLNNSDLEGKDIVVKEATPRP